ncbi:MAG: aquaporin [Candidatus Micrarchaeota archaeon]|nr:aquaporin [Candidatus Micrarchaeota archaeon]
MAIEALGTFILTFISAGAIISTSYLFGTGIESLLIIAAATGIALAIAVTIAAGISGGHINPAVTLGFWVTGRITAKHALAYIIAQVIGAVIGAAILFATFPAVFGSINHWGTPMLAQNMSITNAIAIEGVLTFFLVLTVFGTLVDRRNVKVGGLAVGLTQFMAILCGGVFTGAVLNPARAIGPALVSMTFTNWYVWWIGPIFGGILAAVIYDYVFLRGRKIIPL